MKRGNMEIAIIVTYILLTIFFGILIKDYYEKQKRGQIVIFKNSYDMFFNVIVYIAPAIIFFVEIENIDKLLCYILMCVGFTILLCISAFSSNNSLGKKITASIIKVITGIESIFVCVFILIILFLLFNKSNRRNDDYYYDSRGRKRRR